MFYADKWAAVFLSSAGKNSHDALLCLKALVPYIKNADGALFGKDDAVKLEKMLRGSAKNAGITEADMAVECAIRFICLLVERKYFRYADMLLEKIEHTMDKRNGILSITVETAIPMDSDYKKDFAQMIKDKTGAAELKMKTSVKPHLLGGYMLRCDDYYIDASLKGQLDQMKADLYGGCYV